MTLVLGADGEGVLWPARDAGSMRRKQRFLRGRLAANRVALLETGITKKSETKNSYRYFFPSVFFVGVYLRSLLLGAGDC